MAKTITSDKHQDKHQDTQPKVIQGVQVAGYQATPNIAWRSRVEDYTDVMGPEKMEKLNKLRDLAYGMALKGASDRDIGEYLGVDGKLVKQNLGDVTVMARAELRIQLKASQIEAALDSKANPITRIWAGKQFAEQTDTGNSYSADGAETGGATGLMITVVQAHRDPTTGKTVAEPSQNVVQAPNESE